MEIHSVRNAVKECNAEMLKGARAKTTALTQHWLLKYSILKTICLSQGDYRKDQHANEKGKKSRLRDYNPHTFKG